MRRPGAGIARRARAAALAALAALAAGAGCQPQRGGGGGAAPAGAVEGYGIVEVRVIDAPFPAPCFAEASVTLLGLEIQPAGTTGDQGFIPVTTTAETFELIGLAGGRHEVFARAAVPAGGYGRVRFEVVEAVLTWHDGYQIRFQIPPDLVKLTRQISLGILPGVVTALTLDFDVAQTFRQAEETFTTDCAALKEPGRITFSPAVRAISPGSLRMINGIVTDGRTGAGFPLVTVTGQTSGGAARSALTGDGSGGEPRGFYVLFLENRVATLTFEAADGRSRTVTVQPGERGTFESVNVTIP